MGEIYSGWVGVNGHILWIGEGGLGLVEVYLEGEKWGEIYHG